MPFSHTVYRGKIYKFNFYLVKNAMFFTLYKVFTHYFSYSSKKYTEINTPNWSDRFNDLSALSGSS
jgi:hypothetical protein